MQRTGLRPAQRRARVMRPIDADAVDSDPEPPMRQRRANYADELNPAALSGASSRAPPWPTGQRHRGCGSAGDGPDIVRLARVRRKLGVAQRSQRAMRRAVAAEFADVPEVARARAGEVADVAVDQSRTMKAIGVSHKSARMRNAASLVA